jgi:hypothetical protein
LPGFKIHIIGGAAAFFCVNYIAYGMALGSQSATLLAAATLGAAFPDVDERHTRQFRAVLVVLCAAAFVFAYSFFASDVAKAAAAGIAFAAVAAAAAIIIKPRHRGIVHTYEFALAFAAAMFLLRGPEAAAAGFLGYASHLLLDSVL